MEQFAGWVRFVRKRKLPEPRFYLHASGKYKIRIRRRRWRAERAFYFRVGEVYTAKAHKGIPAWLETLAAKGVFIVPLGPYSFWLKIQENPFEVVDVLEVQQFLSQLFRELPRIRTVA